MGRITLYDARKGTAIAAGIATPGPYRVPDVHCFSTWQRLNLYKIQVKHAMRRAYVEACVHTRSVAALHADQMDGGHHALHEHRKHGHFGGWSDCGLALPTWELVGSEAG